MRSVGRLALFGVIVLVALSCVAVIEPGQQALRLRFGAPVGGVYEQTAMLKLPWPFETVAVYDVSRLRQLPLGNPPAAKERYRAWGDDGELSPSRNVWIVAAPPKRSGMSLVSSLLPAALPGGAAAASPSESGLADQFALVDSDIILNYRVRDGELDKWLRFSNDSKTRRGNLDMRERAIRNLAMREVTQYLSTQHLNMLLSAGDTSHAIELQKRIQTSFDALNTGVEVVSIAITRLRPPGSEAQQFLEPSIALQNARKLVETQRSQVDTTMTAILGDSETARRVYESILKLREIERTDGEKARAAAPAGSDPSRVVVPDSREAIDQRLAIEAMITATQSQAAVVIAGARNERWQAHMEARRKTAEVLGQAPSYRVDPELYRQRKLMEALSAALPGVRSKYILGIDPSRVNFEFDMQEGDGGLSIYDYIEKK